jgi:hypothetical protein
MSSDNRVANGAGTTAFRTKMEKWRDARAFIALRHAIFLWHDPCSLQNVAAIN